MTTISDTTVRLATLKQALTNEDESIRFNAGLDLLKAGAVEGVAAVIDAFSNDSMVVRLFHASRALATLGTPAVPALDGALQSSNSRVRVDAAFTLFRIDAARRDDLLPYAIAALGSNDRETLSDALQFLGEAGGAAAVAVPALIDALETSRELEDAAAWGLDPRVPIAALLATIAEPADAIVAALVRALASDAPSLRWGAALALGALGACARAAAPALEARLRDERENETVRVEAAYSLGVLGEPETEIVPALLAALRSADWWVRLFAARLLGEMSTPLPAEERTDGASWIDKAFFGGRTVRRVAAPQPAVVEALARALRDRDANVRRNAALALAQLGSAALAAMPALADALATEDVGSVAAEALAKIGDAALPALVTALTAPGDVSRSHAGYALSLINTPAAEALRNAEAERLVDRFQPSVHHFYTQVPVKLDDEKVAAFDALYETTLAQGPGSAVPYSLPYPKHEFLRYLVEHKGLLLHGSGHMDLELLKPLRWSTDGADSGNVSGVYADKDFVRPIYFAVVHRQRCFGLNNGFFDLTDEGKVSEDETQGFDRRFYRLAIGVNGMRRNPWRDGAVYVLPPDTFEYWNEWTSRSPVRPLMRLHVVPRDLPLLADVWGVEWRQAGNGFWVDPEESFPFLQDVQATPIRRASPARAAAGGQLAWPAVHLGMMRCA